MMSSGSGRDKVGITCPLLRPEAPHPGSIASTIATSTPASRKCNAVDRPVKPAPMMTTSAAWPTLSSGRSGPFGVTAAHSESGQRTSAISIVVLSCRGQTDLIRSVCQRMPGKQSVALKNIVGIDHAVLMVKELDKAAENWKRLGFTLSPRGTHSAHMGTGNYTMMFDPDYMELLGVLAETEHNAPARAFLAQHGEGIERVAFTAMDATAGAEEIRARGYTPVGPTDFERPVTMPDRTLSAAKFRTFQWPVAEAPGGVRIFACQHKTRETVWIPELMRHANGAKRLRQVLLVAPEPAKEAAHLSRMIDREARNEADAAVAVPSGGDRADFVFLTKAQLGRRYPEVELASLPERGAAGLVIAADPTLTEKALGANGVR